MLTSHWIMLRKIEQHFFGAGDGANGFDSLDAGSAESINEQAVFVGIHNVLDGTAHVFKAFFVQIAFKEAVFDAHAIIFTGFGHPPKAFGIGDVVGHKM